MEFVDREMRKGLDDGMFTAAVLLVEKAGAELFVSAYGNTGGADPSPTEADTLFDLASLTKVCALTPCWALLAQRRPGILDYEISHWFGARAGDKSRCTPRALLAHASGLPHWRPYYLSLREPPGAEALTDMIFAERFMYEPWADTLYSDLGFMILAVILERESEMTTDQCAQEWVFEPIGAPNVLFRPAARGRSIACTRDDEPAGLVHDLNCRALGGVSGHAGLFGDARSVAGIMRQFIESGEQNRLLPHAIIHEFVTRVGRPAHSSRALGFDTPSPGSSSGCCFSPTSFGHTGFTGVSVWLDPEIALTVVLLTNRVYMGESDMRIKDFRPRIHDLVRKELLKT